MVATRVVACLLGALISFCSLASAEQIKAEDPAANIHLTSRHLHRLQLERQRQTPRWLAFDNRVQTVPDSPQRGFELALYYVLSGDAQRGKEAVAWAESHPNEKNQRAIVADWCGDLVSEQQKAEWTSTRAAQDADKQDDPPPPPNELAALLLLSLTPQEFEHPAWQAHVYALEFVSEHPNLPNAQFLQSWVLQADQTLRDGPGVAYEFFWADPYLPGVSYQNMPPWTYDASRGLFARTDWTTRACWISVSAKGVTDQNCPSDWQSKPASFGNLTLLPVTERCVTITPVKNNASLILWKLTPNGKVVYRYENKQRSDTADTAGMLRAPTGLAGKVCVVR